jgi:hypothetical protein
MEMKQTIIISTTLIIAVGIFAMTAVFGMSKFEPIVTQALKQNAIDECSRNSKYIYERADQGIRTEEPIKDNYEKCMAEKGY